MQHLKKTKKLLAWLLAAAVIVTAVPQLPLVANAAEMDTGAAHGTQQVSEVTDIPESEGGMTDFSEGKNPEDTELDPAEEEKTEDTVADSAEKESGGADTDSSKEKEPEENEKDSSEDTEPEEAGLDTDVSEDKESEDMASDSSEEESGEESVPEPSETEEDAESEGTESEKPQDGDAEEKPAEETTIEDPETAGISGNDLGEAAVYAEGVEDTDYGTPLYSGTGAEGSTIEWTIYEGGKLVVTGEGEISLSDGAGRAPWNQYRSEIKSAEIRISGMKNASHMFYRCTYLSALDVSDWDMSGVTDMRGMFDHCSNLSKLDVNGWDMSSVTDTSNMFAYCSALSGLNVSGWDMSSVTNTSNMFAHCSALSGLNVSSWDMGSVTDMSYMFHYCDLSKLDVSGWDVSSVTDMNYMFACNNHLLELDVSGWDVSNVTDMQAMFVSCHSLATLDVSGWNTGSVTNMNHMFSSCNGLYTLDVSGWNTGNVTDMSHMFSGCGLYALDVNGWNVSNVTDMSGMFYGIEHLVELDLSSWDVGQVKSFDSMFEASYTCYIEEIKMPYNMQCAFRLPRYTDNIPWRLPDGTGVTEIPAGNTESITVTRRLRIISFSGKNFILKDSAGQAVENNRFLVRKGAKDTIAFTIEPVGLPEGSILKLADGLPGSISIHNSSGQYQYMISPGDAEGGYVEDVEIPVETVQAESYDITFRNVDNTVIASVYVANGDSLSEENPSQVTVSNAYSTTVYVKLCESENGEIRRPTIQGKLTYLTDPSMMSIKDKEMVQRGYYVFDLGYIQKKTSLQLFYKTMYQARFIMDDLPEDVNVRIKPRESSYKTLKKGTDTVLLEKGSSYNYVEISTDFDAETHPGYKWSVPELSTDVPIEVSKEDTSWKIDYVNYDLVTFTISMAPTRIPLSYVDGEITDLRVDGDHVSLSKDQKSILAYGGNGFAMSFRLADGVRLTQVTCNGGKLAYVEQDGRYTVNCRFGDSADKKIAISTEDSLDRYCLSDWNLRWAVTLNIPRNGYVYNGRAIEPPVQSVTFYRPPSLLGGHEALETLSRSDYTVSYSDNINAGTATVTIAAAEGSKKYKGSRSKTFEISKANALTVYGGDETGASRIPIDIEKAGTVQQADLSELFEINSPYEKNIAPIWYGVKNCDMGDTLTEAPTIQGNMLTYSIMDSITKESRPAKLTLSAAFTNYESISLNLVLQPVKREDLVLGGTITARDQIYDGMPIAFEATDLYVVSVAGQKPENAAAVMAQIQDDLTFQYTGTGGTIYDSFIPPVDVGIYQVSVAVSTENMDYRSEYFEAGTFTISKRAAAITAKDMKLYQDDSAPVQFDYEVSGDGLAKGDTISSEPVLACPTLNMAQIGEYPLIIDVTGVCIRNEEGRDVTANYIISGVNGTLSVQEPGPGSYTVIFDLAGKGDNIKQSGMEAGSLITKPRDPSAEGCVFLGWYSDETFVKLWDFDTDIIQGDLVLYAGWSENLTENDGMTLYVRNILPQTYTGKAIQPVITVYAADGRTLLKKNKDYSVVYKNNVDADTKKFKDQDVIPDGGIGADLTDDSRGFDSRMAYVVVTGKGNYTGKVYINFHINPADISMAGSVASDFTLKYTEQFEEKTGKTAAVVTKLKSKKATLKYGKDYALTVTNTANDTPVTLTSKGQIPLNAGTYRLTIDGIDNYTGSIDKALYVASKAQLLKNAKVTCTGTISDVTKEQLEAGIEPQNLQVSMNGTPLTKEADYEVACSNNYAVGTATVTVKGKGSYFGSKSITFKINGKTFKEKEFETIALQDVTYNGTALTQNDARLKTVNGSELAYGTDYSISYKNNIKKGKATMTFIANPKSGYSGSFKKTFKIVAAGLDSDEVTVDGAAKQDLKWTLSESVPYQKGGATPGSKLTLRLRANGTALTMGKDYTVKYKDNAEVSTGKAYMTLTGKGNFTGTMTVFFDIEKASLAELYKEQRVTVTSKAVKATFSYRRVDDDPEGELKDPDYEFKPAVTVKDGKKALKPGEDYKIEYYGNDRSTLESGSGKPYAMITGIGNYSGTLSEKDEPFNVPLSIYQYLISNSKIYIVYEEDEFIYTGGQIIPKIAAVYYGNASDISKAKKNGETNEAILTTEKPEKEPGEPDPDYEYGLTKLLEYKEGIGGDYIISSYGANKLKGKTGKVTIRGVYNYSGSATSTFTIKPKEIYSLIQETDGAEE